MVNFGGNLRPPIVKTFGTSFVIGGDIVTTYLF